MIPIMILSLKYKVSGTRCLFSSWIVAF